MAEKTYDMSGILFRNEEKEPGDKRPDYTGKMTVKGVEYRMAGWIKESQNGKKFMTLNLQLPKERSAPAVNKPAPPPMDDSDDVPF